MRFCLAALALALACGSPPPEEAAGSLAVLYERAPARPGALELDATHLYWTESSADGLNVMKAPRSGAGPVERIGGWDGGSASLQLLALDGSHVYWVDGAALRKLGKRDGRLATIELGEPLPGGWRLVADREHLYVADRGCGRIGRVAKRGGAPRFVELSGREQHVGARLALDATRLYCGSGPELLAVGKDLDEPPVVLAWVGERETVGPSVVVDDAIYFARNRAVLGGGEEDLAQVGRSGGPILELGEVGLTTAIVRHDEARRRLYWATRSATAGDRVLVYSLTRKSLEVVAEPGPIAGGMTHDAAHLYWAGETAIYRAPK
jgi:hypothetical protein